MSQRPPRSTLFPYPPLCRSGRALARLGHLPLAGAHRLVRPTRTGGDALTGVVAEEQGEADAAVQLRDHGQDLVTDMSDELVDRKSTRLNSSHANTSYARFWL